MAPKRFYQLASLIIILFYALSIGLLPASAEGMAMPSLNSFVASVENGRSTVIRGVYVRDTFALPVIQQPKDNPGYVAAAQDVVTEFGMARRYGTIGMLAHNHLAGENFSLVEKGDKINLVYGNGSIETFIVTKIVRYQALSPNSPYTPFLDLESGKTKTVEQVFYEMYSGERHLTLQTCIAEGDEPSWGRLFIIAEPMPAAQHDEYPDNDR
jgi:hypothetical protein